MQVVYNMAMKLKAGIIGAMQVEVDTLTASMQSAKVSRIGGIAFHEGVLCGCDAVVAKSGVGKVNAALCAHTMALNFGVTHIINTGIAGAMAAGLDVADFVVSTDAMYYDMDAHGFGYNAGVIPQMEESDFQADKALIDAVEKAFEKMKDALKSEGAKGREHKLVKGRIASGDQFVSERAVKNKIKELCSPACVEMEGAGIAHACYLNKVPFVIVRCMSDKADDGEEATYSFNEKSSAEMSAALVKDTLSVLSKSI